jgi:hypothetical protein
MMLLIALVYLLSRVQRISHTRSIIISDALERDCCILDYGCYAPMYLLMDEIAWSSHGVLGCHDAPSLKARPRRQEAHHAF